MIDVYELDRRDVVFIFFFNEIIMKCNAYV